MLINNKGKKFLLVIFLCAIIGIASNYLYLYIKYNYYAKDEYYFETIYNGLNDTNKLVRDRNYEDFIKYGDKSIDYLLKKLDVENKPLLKRKIINLLGDLKCINCTERLNPFLQDNDWRVRFSTLEALDSLDYKSLIPLAKSIVETDSHYKVQIRALMAIGKYGSVEEVIFLEKLTEKQKIKEDDLLIETIDNVLKTIRRRK